MAETPEQIKKKIRWEQKQQMYGIMIFLAWIGIILLLQTFVPGASLFFKESWYVFGTVGMLFMAYLTWKSRSISPSDVLTTLVMPVLGPVGIMFILTWIGLVKIQARSNSGKTTQSIQRG